MAFSICKLNELIATVINGCLKINNPRENPPTSQVSSFSRGLYSVETDIENNVLKNECGSKKTWNHKIYIGCNYL